MFPSTSSSIEMVSHILKSNTSVLLVLAEDTTNGGTNLRIRVHTATLGVGERIWCNHEGFESSLRLPAWAVFGVKWSPHAAAGVEAARRIGHGHTEVSDWEQPQHVLRRPPKHTYSHQLSTQANTVLSLLEIKFSMRKTWLGEGSDRRTVRKHLERASLQFCMLVT